MVAFKIDSIKAGFLSGLFVSDKRSASGFSPAGYTIFNSVLSAEIRPNDPIYSPASRAFLFGSLPVAWALLSIRYLTMSRFSDGFMYGLGFWLAGSVLTLIGAILSVLFLSGTLSLDLGQPHRVASVLPQLAPPPPHVATVTNSTMSQADYDERECNQLVLQLAQNNDPAIKKRMYQVCK